jgi:hypothetical protein
MGLPRPPGSPITLPGDRWFPYRAYSPGSASVADPGGLQERIPWPLTLDGDLGKRRSAQR